MEKTLEHLILVVVGVVIKRLKRQTSNVIYPFFGSIPFKANRYLDSQYWLVSVSGQELIRESVFKLVASNNRTKRIPCILSNLATRKIYNTLFRIAWYLQNFKKGKTQIFPDAIDLREISPFALLLFIFWHFHLFVDDINGMFWSK